MEQLSENFHCESHTKDGHHNLDEVTANIDPENEDKLKEANRIINKNKQYYDVFIDQRHKKCRSGFVLKMEK